MRRQHYSGSPWAACLKKHTARATQPRKQQAAACRLFRWGVTLPLVAGVVDKIGEATETDTKLN